MFFSESHDSTWLIHFYVCWRYLQHKAPWTPFCTPSILLSSRALLLRYMSIYNIIYMILYIYILSTHILYLTIINIMYVYIYIYIIYLSFQLGIGHHCCLLLVRRVTPTVTGRVPSSRPSAVRDPMAPPPPSLSCEAFLDSNLGLSGRPAPAAPGGGHRWTGNSPYGVTMWSRRAMLNAMKCYVKTWARYLVFFFARTLCFFVGIPSDTSPDIRRRLWLWSCFILIFVAYYQNISRQFPEGTWRNYFFLTFCQRWVNVPF